MPDLKLGKLPDREPVKIAFRASPELARMLRDYADAYRQAYGEDEPIEQLLPFILTAFLESDRGFAKARKDRRSTANLSDRDTTAMPARRRREASDSSTPSPD